MNSRFITYPTTVDLQGNSTVVLIDPTDTDIETLCRFLKISERDYDVYLYRGDHHDLEYLDYICDMADYILLHEDSQVTIRNVPGLIKFGPNQQINLPFSYFEKLEPIDSAD